VRPWSATPVTADGPELSQVVSWMASPHVAEFWRQAWPAAVWADEVRQQHSGPHSRPWLVSLDGVPVAYVEVYRVARDVIASCHPVAPHDLGVHIAIGDPDRVGRGLGRRLLADVADALLAADPACGRVLGDPEAGHDVARRAFAAAGFTPVREVDLPHKRAALMARDRAAGIGTGS
jgi:RimJ/RimL family protein N-acetyltransferase